MKILYVLLASFTFFLPLQGESTRYIVKLKPQKETSSKIKSPIWDLVGKGEKKIIKEMREGFVAELATEEAEALLSNPEVETIEKDQMMHLIKPVKIEAVDESSFASGQDIIPEGVKRIKGVSCGVVHATVAIIDTGIDFKRDLNVAAGKNFVNPRLMPLDDQGHGTHVAGTVGAKCNGEGVLGVAPGVKLIALKVLDRDGSGWLSDIIEAVNWVTDHADTIDVVNMSLGGYTDSTLYHQAIQRSVAKGIVYVVAAGNESIDIKYTYPASYPEVMTISAMGDTDGIPGGKGNETSYGEPDDTFAFFSNFSSYINKNNPVVSKGAGIDLAAPGVDILSTYPGKQLVKMSGTSMAAPHAAGAVARFMAEHGRDFNGDGVRNALDVYQIRQAMIDMGQHQSLWNNFKSTNDPDSNHEKLLQVK